MKTVATRSNSMSLPALCWNMMWCLLALLPVPAQAQAQALTQAPAPAGARLAAEALIEAFNRHDPDAMAALVSPDFEMYYVDDDGAAALATRGREQLASEMRAYFEKRPQVQSSISGIADGPRFVSFREQIEGGQSSIAVYQVHDRLIRRVWYYPAE